MNPPRSRRLSRCHSFPHRLARLLSTSPPSPAASRALPRCSRQAPAPRRATRRAVAGPACVATVGPTSHCPKVDASPELLLLCTQDGKTAAEVASTDAVRALLENPCSASLQARKRQQETVCNEQQTCSLALALLPHPTVAFSGRNHIACLLCAGGGDPAPRSPRRGSPRPAAQPPARCGAMLCGCRFHSPSGARPCAGLAPPDTQSVSVERSD